MILAQYFYAYIGNIITHLCYESVMLTIRVNQS